MENLISKNSSVELNTTDLSIVQLLSSMSTNHKIMAQRIDSLELRESSLYAVIANMKWEIKELKEKMLL